MSKERRKTSARERILQTADRLFYAEGIHSVGIDRIIAEAGVAKMTLYNHFPSKDDLILATLEYRESIVFDLFEKSMQKHQMRGKSRLDAYFGALEEWFKSLDFRGCAFINAASELANSSHPGMVFSAAHKKRMHDLISESVRETAGQKATEAVPAIALLVEGAIVMAVFQQSSRPAKTAHEAALKLLEEK